jgi:hypothetical protein
LTIGFSWRAIFWFLAIVSGTSCLSFLLFFNDTFRQERSLAYQNVLERRLKETSNESMLEPRDVEAQAHTPEQNIEDASAEKHPSEGFATMDEIQATPVVKLSLKDVNPFKPLALVLRRWNNVVILFASGKPRGTKNMQCNIISILLGLLFAFAFVIPYTSARTLGSKYNYNSLKIGLVLLSFGIGR